MDLVFALWMVQITATSICIASAAMLENTRKFLEVIEVEDGNLQTVLRESELEARMPHRPRKILFKPDLQDNAETYKFKYTVHDPDAKNFQEKSEFRIGDSVFGYYSVLEPTGHLRTVKYRSDKSGFRTEVSYRKLKEDLEPTSYSSLRFG